MSLERAAKRRSFSSYTNQSYRENRNDAVFVNSPHKSWDI